MRLFHSLPVRAQVNCYPNHLCGGDGSTFTTVDSSRACCLTDISVTKSYAPTDGTANCQPCIGTLRFRKNVAFTFSHVRLFGGRVWVLLAAKTWSNKTLSLSLSLPSPSSFPLRLPPPLPFSPSLSSVIIGWCLSLVLSWIVACPF